MRETFPQGPKVNAFAQNLGGHLDAVTIDAHASQAAFNDVTFRKNLRWMPYSILADAYRDVARTVGLAPCDLQAILWVTWKRRYPRETKKALIRKGKLR